MRIAPVLLLVSACSSPPPASAQADASVSQDARDASDAGGDATAAPADASCDSGSSAGIHYAAVKLDNSFCVPSALPCGCRILFAGVTAGCGQPGLSPAPSSDVTALEALAQAYDASLPAGSVCELQQLAASSTAGAGCADESASGWCYVQGSCPTDAQANCAQAVCTTDGFAAAHESYGDAWLACP
jgi:hypothetical protein